MSIGLQLKQARTQKGVSIKEASSRTKIQEKFLDALENDDFSLLPNALYLKGFLKKYSEFLGLDSDSIVSQLQSSGLKKDKQVIILGNQELPHVRRGRPSILPKAARVNKAVILILIICVIAGLAASYQVFFSKTKPQARVKNPKVVLKKQKKEVKKQAPAVKAAPVVKAAAVQKQPVETAMQPKAQAVPVAEVALNLSVVVRKPCHLSVKADGKLLFESFLFAGAADQWRANKVFELGISDGSALELVVNGVKYARAPRNERRDVIITKDGLKDR